MRSLLGILSAVSALTAASACAVAAPAPEHPYPVHANILSTVFWAGETADSENGYISNAPSAWDDRWTSHFGGVDNPRHRDGYQPAGFTPRENPFYIALPYNDLHPAMVAKRGETVYWASERHYGREESMCKNRWVKVTKGNRVAYGQWEDVGPFLETDAQYVFGTGAPRNTQLEQAGIDLSPAMRDFLKAGDVDRVTWQFVDDRDVPEGPWKAIVTATSTDYR